MCTMSRKKTDNIVTLRLEHDSGMVGIPRQIGFTVKKNIATNQWGTPKQLWRVPMGTQS